MDKVVSIIRQNKLYVFLLIFVIGINLLGFIAEKNDWSFSDDSETSLEASPQEDPAPTDERVLFGEEDMELRQERLKELSSENPLLYLFLGVLNLFVFFIIFLGLVLNILFLTRWIKRRKETQVTSHESRVIDSPRWTVSDVIRVTLIFLSIGYVFVILQGFVVKYFPILDNENFRMVFNAGVANVVGISVIWYFVAKKYGQNLSDVGLTGKNFLNNIKHAAIGYIALIPILFAILLVTAIVTKLMEYQPPVQPIVRIFVEEKESSVLWFSVVFAAIFGPIAEEIFFRGFMYTAFRKKLGVAGAIIVTAGLFSFLHAHIVGFLPILALGILLAYLYEKTNSLVAPIAVHIAHNVGMLILVFFVKALGT